MSATAALQHLDAADRRLASLASDMAALELAIAGDPELERMRAEAAVAQEGQRAAEAAAAAVEQRAGGLLRRAAAIERRLYDGSVGNPQELLSLQHELEGVRGRSADEEESLLTGMEAADEAARSAAVAVGAVAERERERAEAAGPRERRLGELREARVAAAREREEIAATVEPAALALYTRLAGRVRPPLARLNGDSCGGCRHGLGLREVRAVRSGAGLVQCPDCDRILVP